MITPKLTKYTVTQSPAGLRRSRSRSIVTTNLNRRRSLHWGPAISPNSNRRRTGGRKGNILILFVFNKKNLFVCWEAGNSWKRKGLPRLLLVRLLRDHFKVWTLNLYLWRGHTEPVIFGGKIFFISKIFWLSAREADVKAGKFVPGRGHFQILASKSLSQLYQ